MKLVSILPSALILAMAALPNVVLGGRHDDQPIEDDVTSPPHPAPLTASPTEYPSAAPSETPSVVPSQPPSRTSSVAPSSSPTSTPSNTVMMFENVPEGANDLTVCKCDAAQRCDNTAQKVDENLRLCFMTSPLMESSIERIDDLYLHIPNEQEAATLIVVENVIVATGASMRCSTNKNICQVLTPLNEDLFPNNNSLIYARGAVAVKTNSSMEIIEIVYGKRIELTSGSSSSGNLNNSSSNRGLVFGLSAVAVAAVAAVFTSLILASKKWLVVKSVKVDDGESPSTDSGSDNV